MLKKLTGVGGVGDPNIVRGIKCMLFSGEVKGGGDESIREDDCYLRSEVMNDDHARSSLFFFPIVTQEEKKMQI